MTGDFEERARRVSERAGVVVVAEPDEGDVEGPSSWQPIDLTDALSGRDTPPPDILERVDGKHLLYRGRTHWFQGEPESLKSWGAQAAGTQVLQHGGTVGYVDFEDDERGVTARHRALGVDREDILSRFTYVRPEEPLKDRWGAPTAAFADICDLAARSFDLVVIDGVTEAMVTEGLNPLDNADIARWMRLVPKRFANSGSAVVCLDHVTKNRESQGRYAIGGQHKLAGVTGAVYGFEMLKPLSRATSDPIEAAVKVTVHKDRPGHVRSIARAGAVSVMSATSWPDGGVSVAFGLPDAQPAPDLALCIKILEFIATYDGSSQRHIEDNVEGRAQAKRGCLQWMVAPERGWVRVEQKGRSHLHWLTAEGKEHLS